MVRQATHKGYKVILDSNKPGLWVYKHFIPFTNDPETNLWLLSLFPPTTKDNGIYPMPSYSATPTPIQQTKTLATYRHFVNNGSWSTIAIHFKSAKQPSTSTD